MLMCQKKCFKCILIYKNLTSNNIDTKKIIFRTLNLKNRLFGYYVWRLKFYDLNIKTKLVLNMLNWIIQNTICLDLLLIGKLNS